MLDSRAIHAALNYYRAAGPSHSLWSDVGKCHVPVQVRWGARDRYLEEKIAIRRQMWLRSRIGKSCGIRTRRTGCNGTNPTPSPKRS